MFKLEALTSISVAFYDDGVLLFLERATIQHIVKVLRGVKDEKLQSALGGSEGGPRLGVEAQEGVMDGDGLVDGREIHIGEGEVAVPCEVHWWHIIVHVP